MQLDPQNLTQPDVYKVMTGVIVPRPIGWVSTVDPEGTYNLAPFSFFNGVSSNPPAVSLCMSHTPSPNRFKDSLRNISQTGCFVVNIADSALAEAVDRTAGEFDPDINEFEEAGLTPLSGVAVDAPRVAEAPVSLECTLLHSFRVGEGVGSSTLVIGEIKLFHLRDGLLNTENYHVDIGALDPLARLAGKRYTRLGEHFSVQDER